MGTLLLIFLILLINIFFIGIFYKKKFWNLKLKEPSSEEVELYSQIENAIIKWSIEGTETAGSLTREIMKLIEKK
jgi:regulatory protein YycI of two-component signal transduction system YycFG